MMLFATIFKKEGQHLSSFLSQILIGLCQPTLEMISSDFIQYPDFREPFFKLVQNIINHCTQGMFELNGQMFETIIHTVIFAMKHEKPEVMEIGLKCMFDLNDNVAPVQSVCSVFYVSFYNLIIKETLNVMSDCRHL